MWRLPSFVACWLQKENKGCFNHKHEGKTLNIKKPNPKQIFGTPYTQGLACIYTLGFTYANFEFLTKSGVDMWCFRDRDVSPNGKPLMESPTKNVSLD